MKKTFSALLIATFIAYIIYARQFEPTVRLEPLAKPSPAAVALNNTPSAAVTPPVVSVPAPAVVADTTTNLQAQGQVRIINKTSNIIQLVKTTRILSSDGKLFHLADNVTVPAGGQVAVSVYADQNGSAMVIGPSHFTMPGLQSVLQTKIYAVSDAAFSLVAPIDLNSPSVAVATPKIVSPTPAPAKTTPVAPPPPKPKGQYRDGTYTGNSVDAYYGNVQVAAVISGGKLADVQILDYPQDRRTSQMINGQALPILVTEAIQAQSANVDAVSGASETSPAFQRSLSSALAQAKN